MNVKEQLRQAVASNRSHDQERQDKALGRVAHRVGLTMQEASNHTWKVHIS